MLHPTVKTVRHDMRTLVRDAQELFREAATLTGGKAEELRARGLDLLDAATIKAQEFQAAALETGKEIATTTDEYVHANPWRAVAISASIGFLVGLAISRK